MRIAVELYNMQWYLLPLEQQREVCSLIHWIQNGNVLTIGPFGDLDFETASSVSFCLSKCKKQRENSSVIKNNDFSVNQIYISFDRYASQCFQLNYNINFIV